MSFMSALRPARAAAAAGLAVLAFTSIHPSHATDPILVPTLIVDGDCGGCPWHDALARSLARSYVKQSLGQGYRVDVQSAARVSIEQYYPDTGYIAVTCTLGATSFYLAAHDPKGNAGAAIRMLGHRMAEALAGYKDGDLHRTVAGAW